MTFLWDTTFNGADVLALIALLAFAAHLARPVKP